MKIIKWFDSRYSLQKENPCYARVFLFLLYVAMVFTGGGKGVLYAYAYKSMPYYTPYAKWKCKTSYRNFAK